MSVIITLRAPGNPAQLEQWAADNSDQMASIVERAKEHGLIAHRFYGNDDGSCWSWTSGPTRAASTRSSRAPRTRSRR